MFGFRSVFPILDGINAKLDRLAAAVSTLTRLDMATSTSVSALVAAWNQEKQDIASIQQQLAAALAKQTAGIDADDEAAIDAATADMQALHAQLASVAATPTPPTVATPTPPSPSA